jgi:nitrogen fixation NifU-like protein
MSDLLKELYQDLIMDHSRNPRCFGPLEDFTHSKKSYNPLCGDKVEIFLKEDLQGNLKINFEGSGCAMCMSSTSLLLEALQNKKVLYACELVTKLLTLLKGNCSQEDKEFLGKLLVFEGVNQYPSRVKCVTLSWHALREILESIEGRFLR